MTIFADFGIPDYVVTDRVARSALLFAQTPRPGAVAQIAYDPANGPVPIYSYLNAAGSLVTRADDGTGSNIGFGICVVEITQDEVDRAVAAGDTLQLQVFRHGHYLSNGQIVIDDSLRVGEVATGQPDLAAIRATAASRENLLFSEHTLNQV